MAYRKLTEAERAEPIVTASSRQHARCSARRDGSGG